MKKVSRIRLAILGLSLLPLSSASSCMCSCSDVMDATKATVQVLAFTGEVVGGILRSSGETSANSALTVAGSLTKAISQSVGAAMARATETGAVFTAKGFEAETIQLLAGVVGYRVPQGTPLERGFRAVFDLTADGHGTTALYWTELVAGTPIFEINFDVVSDVLTTTSVPRLERNDYTPDEKAQVKAQFDAYRTWAGIDPVRVAMVNLLEPCINKVAEKGWSDFTEFDSTKKAYLSLTNRNTDPTTRRFATIYLPNPPETV